MISLSIGSTIIYLTPLVSDCDSSLRARQREQATIEIMVKAICGPEASYTHAQDGAPIIVGCQHHISVSHGGGYVAIAFNPLHPIGIDIETDRTKQLEKVKSRFLSPTQLVDYNSNLLEAWTAKEALFKALNPEYLYLLDIPLPHPSFKIYHRYLKKGLLLTLAEKVAQE
ncbi:MAG: 4'-phosphopantetheinyl transferase superfamily protein [Bacteroidales bacterium]|nr:4'-phosphopantetheinyl transferase superfamily protein [Bacteroidales bacterium]